MKKKLGVILTAGVLACTMTASLALTACGGKTKPDFEMPEGGFNSEAPVTIQFYHTMGQDLQKPLNTYIEEFKKLYPNITVNHTQVGSYDDVRDQIQTEIVGGNQPNLAYCYPDHVALFNVSNAVQSLNDFLPGGAYADMTVTQADGKEVPLGMTEEEKDMFIPGYYEEGYLFDDGSKMYTLPFSKSTEVLYYNKTYFDAHEADGLKVPTTWTEMEEACAKILELEENSGNKVIPLGYDSEANWFITMCEQLGSGYTSSEGDKYLFDNATNRAFVEKFKGWYDAGYVTTQEIYGSYTSGLFTNVTNAEEPRGYMCIGSSAGAKNQVAPLVGNDYAFEVGVTSIPQEHPENPKVISQGPSVCIFKSEDPQEVLASWLFLKYLTTNIDFQAEFASVSGYVPVLTQENMRQNAVYDNHLNSANGTSRLTARAALVCMEQAGAYYTSPAFVGSSEARDQVGLLMKAALLGTKGIAEAFRDAIDECEYFG